MCACVGRHVSLQVSHRLTFCLGTSWENLIVGKEMYPMIFVKNGFYNSIHCQETKDFLLNVHQINREGTSSNQF